MADDLLVRVAPQNLEAEQSVLGAVLLDNGSIGDAIELLTAEDFYREPHRQIFRAMIALTDARSPVDAVTLAEKLRTTDFNWMDSVGGPAYLAELASIVPSSAMMHHYARIVREKSVYRSFISEGAPLVSEAYDAPGDVDAFLDKAERRLLTIGGPKTGSNFVGMGDATRDAIKAVERLFENPNVVSGVSTGFRELDKLTGGLQNGQLVVLAARTSVGKTALALNIMANAALAGVPAAFFSLEMLQGELMVRMLCSEARVDSQRMRSGFLTPRDFEGLAGAAARISETELVIDDDSSLTPVQLKSACRRYARSLANRGKRLGLVGVDYIQLMNPGREYNNREEGVAVITRSLKALAKELQIPVLALSQLNRQVETRADRRPMLADLRESGAIEQDADVVAFIYRDEMYHKDSKDPGIAEIIIAKQRNGPTDTVKLSFLKHLTRFEDLPEEYRLANGG